MEKIKNLPKRFKNVNKYFSSEEIQEIEKFWKFDRNEKFSKKLHWFLTKQNPFCSENNKKKFIGLFSGYLNVCENKNCNSCNSYKQNLKNNWNLIAKKHFKEKYGVENPSLVKQISQKRSQNNIKKYGTASTLNEPITKQKIKNINIQKYGNENPFGSDVVKQKIKQKIKLLYNVENVSQLPHVKQKISKSKQKYFQMLKSQTLEKKLRKNIEKYSKPNPNKEDFIATKLEKYYGKQTFEILNDREKLNEMLKKYSLMEISSMLNVSYSKIAQLTISLNLRKKFENSFENSISQYLLNNKIEYTKHKKPKWLNGLELDFVIPKYNVAIEANGLYWHSSKFKNQNYHLHKLEMCKSNNVKMIIVWEHLWYRNRELYLKIFDQLFFDQNYTGFFVETFRNKLPRDFLDFLEFDQNQTRQNVTVAPPSLNRLGDVEFWNCGFKILKYV